MSPWFIYIVQCRDKSLYTGITKNVEQRIAKHNEGKGAAYTRSHRPVALVWSKKMKTESAARKKEAAIKKLSREKKLELIQGK